MNVYLNKKWLAVLIGSFLFLQFLVVILYINSVASLNSEINDMESRYNNLFDERQTLYDNKVKDVDDDIFYYGDSEGFLKIESKEVENIE